MEKVKLELVKYDNLKEELRKCKEVVERQKGDELNSVNAFHITTYKMATGIAMVEYRYYTKDKVLLQLDNKNEELKAENSKLIGELVELNNKKKSSLINWLFGK